MSGRVAIVTGGTRGIGAAISAHLLQQGYRVAAVYHSSDAAAEAFRRATGAEIFRWDVSSYEQCVDGVRCVRERFGTAVDILINNAGITRDGMFHKSTPEDWRVVIETNLLSCFNMTHAVIDGMRDQNWGRIINISSINAQKGQLGQTNYCAAKAGLLGFTKALALENAKKGVTVNAIAPGYIDTDMVRAVPENVLQQIVAQIPVGRLGTSEEIAEAVSFLISDKAGFMTGATLTINGGQFMTP
ncbi:MAG: acetoacetyl-CoA reductase [Holosporales bacterium]